MDWTLFQWINGAAGRWTAADEFFRFFANDYIVPSAIVALLVIVWFSSQGRWRRAVVHAIVALLLANLMVKVSNYIWFRPRPFTWNEVNLLFYYPSDSSFPSNSAAAVWSMAWALWLSHRESRLARFALLLATLMGFSRIWVGVHYPLDIIGGIAVGFIAAWVVARHQQRVTPLANGIEWLARKLALA